jgi:enoyl-CoA hydratase/carnithine racemase
MMTHAMPQHPLPLDELTGWILGATAPKVGRDAVAVVDLDDDPGWDAPPLPASLPHVVVGTTREADGLGHPGAPACDVVLAPGTRELAAVLASVEAHPDAARTLVQLLRGQPERSIAEGLEAESRAYSHLQGGPDFQRWLAGRTRRPREEEGDPVRLERRPGPAGDHLLVTLQRPHKRNALDAAMQQALVDAFTVAADPGIATIELRGDGPTYSSGGDLDEFGTFESPDAAHRLRLERSAGRAIAAVADKVTAHLHGACAGSGVELPAFAGRVIAAPGTTLALPELALGLIPGAGGTMSLTRRIGRHRTALLALRDAPIDAETALGWGLVDELEA